MGDRFVKSSDMGEMDTENSTSNIHTPTRTVTQPSLPKPTLHSSGSAKMSKSSAETPNTDEESSNMIFFARHEDTGAKKPESFEEIKRKLGISLTPKISMPKISYSAPQMPFITGLSAFELGKKSAAALGGPLNIDMKDEASGTYNFLRNYSSKPRMDSEKLYGCMKVSTATNSNTPVANASTSVAYSVSNTPVANPNTPVANSGLKPSSATPVRQVSVAKSSVYSPVANMNSGLSSSVAKFGPKPIAKLAPNTAANSCASPIDCTKTEPTSVGQVTTQSPALKIQATNSTTGSPNADSEAWTQNCNTKVANSELKTSKIANTSGSNDQHQPNTDSLTTTQCSSCVATAKNSPVSFASSHEVHSASSCSTDSVAKPVVSNSSKDSQIKSPGPEMGNFAKTSNDNISDISSENSAGERNSGDQGAAQKRSGKRRNYSGDNSERKREKLAVVGSDKVVGLKTKGIGRTEERKPPVFMEELDLACDEVLDDEQPETRGGPVTPVLKAVSRSKEQRDPGKDCELRLSYEQTAAIMKFRSSFIEAVEELRMRRMLDADNEQKIEDLLGENHNLERKLVDEKTKNSNLIAEHERNVEVIKRDSHDQLKALQAEKAKYQIMVECKEKELGGLKEEIRSLQMIKYSLDKKVTELEHRIHMYNSMKDTSFSQVSECEKRSKVIEKKFDEVKAVQSRLEKNVQESIKINHKLSFVNKHQLCEIEDYKAQVSKLKQENIDLKVAKEIKPQDYDQKLLSKCQEIEKLRKLIKEKDHATEQSEKLVKELNEEKQSLMKSLDTAHQLIDEQVRCNETILEDTANLVKTGENMEKRYQLLAEKYDVKAAEFDTEVSDHQIDMEQWKTEEQSLNNRLQTLQHDHEVLTKSHNDLEDLKSSWAHKNKKLLDDINSLRAQLQKEKTDVSVQTDDLQPSTQNQGKDQQTEKSLNILPDQVKAKSTDLATEVKAKDSTTTDKAKDSLEVDKTESLPTENKRTEEKEHCVKVDELEAKEGESVKTMKSGETEKSEICSKDKLFDLKVESDKVNPVNLTEQ